MKSLRSMRMTFQLLLAFARIRSGRVSTSSFADGFSSSIDFTSSTNESWDSIGRVSVRKISSCRRNCVSEKQCDGPFDRTEKLEKKWLVVGDGDLSYSATIAGKLAKKNIQLFATVLEDENIHNTVYKRSSQNKAIILSFPKRNNLVNISNTTNFPTTTIAQPQHHVRFEIDATRLQQFFPSYKFHTIEFNFPHWRGKTNAKRNRQLLDSFMASACEVLHDEGEIIISLCKGQGGFPALDVNEWKRSWLVPEYAAKHGLLLRDLMPYEPSYQQTSHRGKDRPWLKDGTSQRYTFTFPNGKCIGYDLQLSCRHELRIVLPDLLKDGSSISKADIIEGDAVFQLTKKFVPDGIRMEVVAREIIESYVFNDEDVTLAIFLLNYSGERMPLTRNAADGIRSELEVAVREQWGFEVAKGGRLVSRPYPTHLLPSLIKESYERKN